MYQPRQLRDKRPSVLPNEENVCVPKLNRVRFVRQYAHVLTTCPAGIKGGTVIPPCDFQGGTSETTEFIGVTRLIPSRSARADARSRVQAQPQVINPLNNKLCATKRS